MSYYCGVNNITLTGSLEITGSLNVRGKGITGSLFGTASYATFAITSSYLSGSVATASYALTASYLSEFATASYALTASYISGSISVDTGSLATTGSNQFDGSQTITGSLILGNWRLIESGSNLSIEKYDGASWIQSGYFEI